MELIEFYEKLAFCDEDFKSVIKEMIWALDEADKDDYYGKKGWKHLLGLE